MKKKKEGLKITRRQFLKGAAATGIGLALPLKFGVREARAFAQQAHHTADHQPGAHQQDQGQRHLADHQRAA